MRSNGHYSNGLPVGGFLRRVPFWLGAVIVSFVPTKILPTIEYLLLPSQAVGSLTLDEARQRVRAGPDSSGLPPTQHRRRGHAWWGAGCARALSRARANHPRPTHTSWGRAVLNSPTCHPSPAPRGSTSGAQLVYAAR